MHNYIVRSNEKDWQPLVEAGVDTKGIFVKPLRFDADTRRAPTILLRFEPGAAYPYHNHPAGEEILVLEGEATIAGAQLIHEKSNLVTFWQDLFI